MSKTINEVKAAILDTMHQNMWTSNGAHDVELLARAYATMVDAQYREWSYSTAKTEPKDQPAAEPPAP